VVSAGEEDDLAVVHHAASERRAAAENLHRISVGYLRAGKQVNLPATQRLAEGHARDERWDIRDPQHPGVEEDRG
jgi:hypothetical protein